MILQHLVFFNFFTGASTSTAAPVVVTPPEQQKGGSNKRKSQKWYIEVDGVPVVFDSIEELIRYLSAQEETKVEEIEEKAEKDAKRVIALGHAKAKVKPPVFKIESPVEEIRDYVDDVQKKIDRMYWRALASAIARDTEEEEDIRFIASLDL